MNNDCTVSTHPTAYNHASVLSSRQDAIAAAVKDKIDDKMEEFGWRILQCLVVNVDPDQGVKNAMNAIESARRHKTAAETKAEADKFVLIRNANAEAESKALQGTCVKTL